MGLFDSLLAQPAPPTKTLLGPRIENLPKPSLFSDFSAPKSLPQPKSLFSSFSQPIDAKANVIKNFNQAKDFVVKPLVEGYKTWTGFLDSYLPAVGEKLIKDARDVKEMFTNPKHYFSEVSKKLSDPTKPGGLSDYGKQQIGSVALSLGEGGVDIGAKAIKDYARALGRKLTPQESNTFVNALKTSAQKGKPIVGSTPQGPIFAPDKPLTGDVVPSGGKPTPDQILRANKIQLTPEAATHSLTDIAGKVERRVTGQNYAEGAVFKSPIAKQISDLNSKTFTSPGEIQRNVFDILKKNNLATPEILTDVHSTFSDAMMMMSEGNRGTEMYKISPPKSLKAPTGGSMAAQLAAIPAQIPKPTMADTLETLVQTQPPKPSMAEQLITLSEPPTTPKTAPSTALEAGKVETPSLKPLPLSTKEVPIKDLFAHGAPELRDAIKRIKGGSVSRTEGPIEVTQRPAGEIVVLDGQHRVVQAMNNGETNIKINVVPYEDAINPEFGYTARNLVAEGDVVPFSSEVKTTQKYKSVEEFSSATKKPSTPLADLSKTNPEFIKRISNNDGTVTIFRNVGVDGTPEIKPFDYVSTNKEYVKGFKSGGKIIEQKIPISDLSVSHGMDATTKGEMFYTPKSQLTDTWNKAQKKSGGVSPVKVIKPTPATSNVSTPLSGTKQSLVSKSKVSPPAKKTLTQTESRQVEQTKENKAYTDSITQPIENVKGAKETFETFDAIEGAPTLPPVQVTEIGKLTNGADKLKDISGFKGQARDIYRNFEQVFGKDSKAKEVVLDKFDEAKGASVDTQASLIEGLKKNVVEKYGFKKGSKESAAIMDYGEGLKTEDELVKEFGPKTTKDIIASSDWFRSQYDDLLEQVNKIREQIYPNSPEKLIPKRKDYFRHFTELSEGFEGLKNAFETPAGISPQLSGISPFTTPKSKFLSFAQRRLGFGSKRDAIGGYLNYIPSASYAIHIDPQIGRFRELAKELALKTEETKNVNNFIEFLQDYANDLAGKTNPADRYVQKVVPGGRVTMRVIDWVNKRIKANVILGNLSSAIAQIFNVPQGIASAKQYSVRGATKTLAQIFTESPAMAQSNFIKERYGRSIYSQFDTGILQNTKKFAAWLVGALDEVGTKFIWNSHYEKALAEKMPNPVNYADGITRKLVAGRGVGEVPLIQKSKLFQIVAPFQLEVGNAWWTMKDMVSAKDFAGIAIFLVASYLMNRVAEKIRGSDVVFDPINAIYDGTKAFQEEDNKAVGAMRLGGRLAGEVLSNVPGGQTLAGLYPEYGVGGVTRKELFGKGDPTRSGGGILLISGLQDPLFKVLPGFGGGQLKKSIEGIKAVAGGGVYDKKGKKQFDVGGTVLKDAQAVTFGKYASGESKDFFNPQSSKELYNKIQKLQPEEKKKVIDEMSDEDYKSYRKGKAYSTVEQVQKLNSENKKDEVKQIIDKLSVEEYQNYLSAKKEIAKQKEKKENTNIFGLVSNYTKAFLTDPENAWKALTTKERLGLVKGNLVELKRDFNLKWTDVGGSQDDKKKMMAAQGIPWSEAGDWKREHILQVKAGGGNEPENLILTNNELHDFYTPIDILTAKAVQSGKITRKQAKALMIDFKVKKILSAENLIKQLK